VNGRLVKVGTFLAQVMTSYNILSEMVYNSLADVTSWTCLGVSGGVRGRGVERGNGGFIWGSSKRSLWICGGCEAVGAVGADGGL